jgi:hypothetical protein
MWVWTESIKKGETIVPLVLSITEKHAKANGTNTNGRPVMITSTLTMMFLGLAFMSGAR